MIFGFSLLLILAGLALAVAIGHVEEKTSYGLMPLLTSLSTLAGVFSQWAFGSPAAPPGSFNNSKYTNQSKDDKNDKKEE